jgi:hypothetical protein
MAELAVAVTEDGDYRVYPEDPGFFKGYVASELPGGFVVAREFRLSRLIERALAGQGKKAFKARPRKKFMKKTVARVHPSYRQGTGDAFRGKRAKKSGKIRAGRIRPVQLDEGRLDNHDGI